MNKFQCLIPYVINAHFRHSKLGKDVRRWDGETPYFIHPLWCAMTLLTEEKLSKEIRFIGAQVLLLHDIIEDTDVALPKVDDKVKDLVKEMTFDSFEHEMREIWNRSIITKLLKLYDKVSNLLDGGWMTPEKHRVYVKYTQVLVNFVRKEYGELNIVQIAECLFSSVM